MVALGCSVVVGLDRSAQVYDHVITQTVTMTTNFLLMLNSIYHRVGKDVKWNSTIPERTAGHIGQVSSDKIAPIEFPKPMLGNRSDIVDYHSYHHSYT